MENNQNILITETSRSGTVFYNPRLFLPAILILTVIIYVNTLTNDFVNFDDHLFVTENKTIERFSWENIRYIFTTQTGGHIQPVTQITYMLDYLIAERNPSMYHFTSLIIHLINILLVFQLVFLLTKRYDFTFWVTLFFSIHPMNVESVCWVSGRNGLLFSLFYLVALIFYIHYIQHSLKQKYIYYTFLFFIISVFSKSGALSLPILMFLIDYYSGRKLNRQLLLEKVPFLIVSFFAGIMALWAASELGSMNVVKIHYTLPDKFFMLFYSFTFYIIKVIFPVNLLMMHFSPMKENGFLPLQYYTWPFIALLALFFIFRYVKPRKDLIFGFALYIITIGIFLLVLIFSVGSTIASERYAYLPNVGLLFLFFTVFINTIENRYLFAENVKPFFNILLAILFVLLSITTWNRVKVWENGVTLFGDFIKKYPKSEYGYWGRGSWYMKVHEFEKSMEDLNKAVELKPKDKYARNSRGILKSILKDYAGSLEDFNVALSIDTAYTKGYVSRAYSKFELGDYRGCIDDYNKAFRLDKKAGDPNFYYYRGSAKSGIIDYNGAIPDFNKAIELQFDTLFFVYYNRGNAYKNLKQYEKAISDYTQTIRLNPDFADAFNNRGISYYFLKKYKEAIHDYDNALSLKPGFESVYNNRGNAKYFLGDTTGACEDWRKAYELGYINVKQRIDLYCKE